MEKGQGKKQRKVERKDQEIKGLCKEGRRSERKERRRGEGMEKLRTYLEKIVLKRGDS